MADFPSTRFRVPRHWSLAQRLAHYTEKNATPSGCILWCASVGPFGYGTLRWQGRMHSAHRLSWQAANGAIPAGLCILHRCDNPPCVNVAHLFLGTRAINNTDRRAKGREGDRRGERNGRAKLTVNDVLAIRIDSRPRRIIAAHYGIALSTLRDIRSGRLWRHVSKDPAPAKAEAR